MPYHKRAYATPGRLLIIAVLMTVTIGSLLLALPFAQKTALSLWDVIFTATSAVSVTGLMTVPLEAFTWFGQLIILLLIQIGGLGVITLSIFLMSFITELGLGAQFLAGHILELDSIRGIRSMIKFIVGFTLIAELSAALLLLPSFPDTYTFMDRLWYALAHSISSFCNAGFVFMPEGLIAYRTNVPFLLITSICVLVGSLGFITWKELIRYIHSYTEKKHFHMSLHTTIVLASTVGITLMGMVLLWLLEYRHSFFDLSSITTVSNLFFDAVCARSAGMSTLDMSLVRLPTLFIIIIISFIGSSPGSTGSGIKTTTFAIFLATIRSVITGKPFVEIKGRSIPKDQVFKAMAVFSLSLTWIAMAIFALLVSEEGWNFIDIMFEAFSAFSNTGFSTGITPHLSAIGKFLIVIVMIIGRIGSLTLLLSLKRRPDSTEFHYPEEKIMLS